MKRFLATIALAVALTGFVGVPAAAAAQKPVTTNPTVTTQTTGATAANTKNKLGSNGAKQQVDYTLATQHGMNSVMVWITSLFALLVGAATILLDYAAYYTVVGMGSFVHNLGAIGLTWSILRDIGNIMLIFGFLIAGISVIVDLNLYGWSKKMIPMLLVAAVFLNFSLFISEAIIDVGNLFATEFYVQINGGHMPMTVTQGNINPSKSTLSDAIMANLGIQTIYGDAQQTHNQLLASNHPFLVGFLSIILFIMISFVMFALAGILIARFVALIYYIIISPLGFAGLAVPSLNGLAKSWWSGIVKQTITAPILFLLLYIALRIITAADFLTGLGLNSGNANSAATGFVGNTNLVGYGGFILSFVVAIGLLLGVIVVAQKLGAQGTRLATRAAGRLSFGTVSTAGLAFGGGLGLALSNKHMQRWATNPDGSPRKLRRFLVTEPAKYLSKRTYDVRNVGVSKGLKSLGIDAGSARTTTPREFAEKNFDLEQTGRYGLNKITPLKKAFDASDKEYKEAASAIDLKDAMAAIRNTKKDLDAGKIDQATYEGAVKEQVATVEKQMAKASPKRFAEIINRGGAAALGELLTSRQFVKAMENEDVSSSEKEELKNARFRKLNAALKDAEGKSVDSTEVKAARAAVAGLSDQEVQYVNAPTLQNSFFVQNLSSKQFVTGMEKLENRGTREAFRNARFGGTLDKVAKAEAARITEDMSEAERQAAQETQDAARKAVQGLSTDEAALLGSENLMRAFVARSLSEDTAKELQKKDFLNAHQKAEIKARRDERFKMGADITASDVASEVAALKWNAKKLNEQVPREVFTNPEVLNAFKGKSLINLVGLVADDKLDLPAQQMQELREYLQKVPDRGDATAAQLAAYFGQVSKHREAIYGKQQKPKVTSS